MTLQALTFSGSLLSLKTQQKSTQNRPLKQSAPLKSTQTGKISIKVLLSIFAVSLLGSIAFMDPKLERLSQLFNNPSHNYYQQVLSLGESRASNKLGKILQEESLRTQALSTLRQEWTEQLNSDDPGARQTLMGTIAKGIESRTLDAEKIGLLLPFYASPHPDVRQFVVKHIPNARKLNEAPEKSFQV